MREAVLYFAKDQVQQFLSQQLSPDTLLGRATLFSRHGEHPAEQVQYLSAMQQPQHLSPPHEESREASPLPSPAEQELPQESQAVTTLGTEVSQSSSRLVESSAPKKHSKVRANKRKRRSRRAILHRPSHNTPTIVTVPATNDSPATVLPGQREENRSTPTLPK